MTISKS